MNNLDNLDFSDIYSVHEDGNLFIGTLKECKLHLLRKRKIKRIIFEKENLTFQVLKDSLNKNDSLPFVWKGFKNFLIRKMGLKKTTTSSNLLKALNMDDFRRSIYLQQFKIPK